MDVLAQEVAPTSFNDAILDKAQEEGPKAAALIVGVGIVAFGIKGLWVGWRAGSKAVGKTGA